MNVLWCSYQTPDGTTDSVVERGPTESMVMVVRGGRGRG